MFFLETQHLPKQYFLKADVCLQVKVVTKSSSYDNQHFKQLVWTSSIEKILFEFLNESLWNPHYLEDDNKQSFNWVSESLFSVKDEYVTK